MWRKGSILVIDDEEIIREAFEALLASEGYRVQSAETAQRGRPLDGAAFLWNGAG